MSKTYKKEKTDAMALNRTQKRALRRKVKKYAKAASKEALAKMDDGLYNVFKAQYNVKVRIGD